MENMQYAEELVREFLVFRGFTNTLQAFEAEVRTDIGKGFEVDKLLDLIFSVYIPGYQAEKLAGLLSFFKQYISSYNTTVIATLSKLEDSIVRYYIVYAVQSGRKDKAVEYFEMNGNALLLRSSDWSAWFAIPYLNNPRLNPQFRIYFSKEWHEALRLSVRNFFSEIFNGNRIPSLLKISSDKISVNRLKNDIRQLNLKLSELQVLLEEKEAQLGQKKSNVTADARTDQTKSLTSSTIVNEETSLSSADSQEISVCCAAPQESVDEAALISTSSMLGRDSNSRLSSHALPLLQRSTSIVNLDLAENGKEMHGKEEFPEVKVEFQETFLGHTSPISRCRFSASGNNIASASVDGTVRIWTYDSSTSASRNATIYCGTEIMSLEWECKSDRLLLIGTADGGIKAWNVDAKRVVCDLNTNGAFRSVLDLKCSPVEPVFVSAAASRRPGTGYIESLGFASLTVWNMKTWKAMTVLPLGEDPPAITSLCFNHNGKILAASATDGMIHMFDMSAGLQITGWPGHDSAISSILFGPDETSIFSLGTDGKIFEWSLHNQGQVVWSRDCSRFCDLETPKQYRHEMALDAYGRRLITTSGLVRAPIYQVRDHANGFKTLPHSAPITTVDWHPSLPIFLTGSADNSVRVTSIL